MTQRHSCLSMINMISHPYAPIPSANGLGAGFGYLNNFSQGIWSTRERDFQAYVYYNDLWLYDFVLAGRPQPGCGSGCPFPPTCPSPPQAPYVLPGTFHDIAPENLPSLKKGIFKGLCQTSGVYIPLDPKTMKNEGFRPSKYGS